jgi:hypothetical protein
MFMYKYACIRSRYSIYKIPRTPLIQVLPQLSRSFVQLIPAFCRALLLNLSFKIYLKFTMAEQVMEGKFYSITGAGSGIGRATAIRCVQLGAAGLTLCDLNMDGLEETKKLMWVFSTLIPIISIAYFY